MLSCDNISYKCTMRKLVLRLQQVRARGELGTLGPVIFAPVSDFLAAANAEAVRDAEADVCQIDRPGVDQQVVAIGDVHGDLLAFLSALYLSGVITEGGFWCGGEAIVVQLGDIFDRGGRGVSQNTSLNAREEIDILQYIHALDLDARLTGGRVISIVGNHEADKFTTSSGQSHADVYETELLVGGWGGVSQKRLLFRPMSALAVYFAHYKPIVLRVNDFLFCHGGIVPEMLEPLDTVASMNTAWRGFLRSGAPLPRRIQEIYWNRDLSLPDVHDAKTNQQCFSTVEKVFQKLKIATCGGIVVAHTVQADGIPLYCRGKVWRVDVALSEAFGRRMRPIEVLLIKFNHHNWDVPTTIVQIIKGLQYSDRNVERSTTEIHNYIDGVLQWVDKISRAQMQG